MAVSMQVLYPISDDTHFDMEYYLSTHMKMVGDHIGGLLQSASVSKGLAGGPDAPPGYYAIATLVFADQATLDAAMPKTRPLLADIPNFTNAQPQLLIGEVVA